MLREHHNCNWLNYIDIKIKLPLIYHEVMFWLLKSKETSHKLIINQDNSNKDRRGGFKDSLIVVTLMNQET